MGAFLTTYKGINMGVTTATPLTGNWQLVHTATGDTSVIISRESSASGVKWAVTENASPPIPAVTGHDFVAQTDEVILNDGESLYIIGGDNRLIDITVSEL